MIIKDLLRKIKLVTFLPFFTALLIFLVVRLAIINPQFIERYYSRGVYPYIAACFSMISNSVPFSLWDLVWILIILMTIIGFFLVISRTVSPKRYFFGLIRWLMIFYSIFYISWGFNYYRPSLDKRLGWEKMSPDEKQFDKVFNSVIRNANDNYIKISASDYSCIDNLLEESYNRCSTSLGIDYPSGYRRPKNMILSSYFARSGISGYFGPLFNEVHVNSYELPSDYPFTLAHEKAHQFGIANEAEANIAAFIVCTSSEDQRLKYSGYMYLMLYFLKDAEKSDNYQEYLDKIDTRVMDDLRFRERYYRVIRSKKMEDFQNSANDVYLKSNSVSRGIKNYNQVVGLAITWYRHAGLV
jgi:hypothetical protein